MSMPNIPDISPEIKLKREDVINLLLASIALEELGLAHLINAEGEKLQKVIEHAKCMEDVLEINRSVEKMLKTIIKKEMILQFKLDEVLEIPDHRHEPPHHHDHEPPKDYDHPHHHHHDHPMDYDQE